MDSVVIAQHARYAELCQVYGEPIIQRSTTASINPNTLAARVVKITFRLDEDIHTLCHTNARKVVMSSFVLAIPKSFTIYNVLGILGREIGLPPPLLSLVWETGEMEVVPVEKDDWTDFDEAQDIGPKPSLMRLREEPLRPETRVIGSWIDYTQAIVRIELTQQESLRNLVKSSLKMTSRS